MSILRLESLDACDFPTNSGSKPFAIVLGCCGHGLSIIHSLVSMNVPVIALEANKDLPGVNTSFAKVIIVDEINGEGLIKNLLRLRELLVGHKKPVLFPVNDRMVRLIGDHVDVLGDGYFTSLIRCQDKISSLVDKASLEKRCLDKGLNYPQTFSITSVEQAGIVWKKLGAPIILKPSIPLSSFKTFIPKDFSDLKLFLCEKVGDMPILAQKYIPGGDHLINFSAFHLENGSVVAHFEGRKIRSRPMGHTTIAEPFPSIDVFNCAQRFFDGLELSGPVSLEVKRDTDGNLWVIEPTVGRSDFWVDLCVENGVNLPYIEYCCRVGLPFESTTQKNVVVWFNEERDPFGRLWLMFNPSFSMKGRKSSFIYMRLRDFYPAIYFFKSKSIRLFFSFARKIRSFVWF